MKKLTLLLALLAFAAVGCAEETEVEMPDGDDIVVEDEDVVDGLIDTEVDSLGNAMDSLGDAMEDNLDAAEDAADEALDGDADGDGQ